jgi:gas vesicle protein
MKSGKVALGLLAGIATGALMGILFAPEKGSVTRKRITCKCNDIMDEVSGKINNMANTINDTIDEAKSASENLITKAQDKMLEVKKEINT